jgi:glycerol-3-phosphate dehydrogenase
VILRDVSGAAKREFDLIVVGGGIYGASVLNEAARRGLSAALFDAGDFGCGTSSNSLRILHGGLRYLQTMDLRRFFQSVSARREMARKYSRIVRTLSCLMPLYGGLMKSPPVMRMALLANDTLGAARNVGLAGSHRLPRGEVLSVAQTQAVFPQVRPEGLRGAARWYDYFMVSSERLLIEQLRDACTNGAVAINHARVEELVIESGAARGVVVRDELAGSRITVRARAVVNCAGPRVRELATGRGGDIASLFRPSLAFNLLLDAKLPANAALGVSSPQPNAPVLFLIPQAETVLAGTMHLPRSAETTEAVPTPQEIQLFLSHIRGAVPGLNVGPEQVRRVFAGLLPAKTSESALLSKRELIFDHGKLGGLRNFYSVSGVKYTTSHDVAVQVLDTVTSKRAVPQSGAQPRLSEATELLIDVQKLWSLPNAELRAWLQRTLAEEAVHSLDDLMFRRTNWATTAKDLDPVRARLLELLPEFQPKKVISR